MVDREDTTRTPLSVVELSFKKHVSIRHSLSIGNEKRTNLSLENATESHVMSYMSTEKGLERALEQTSRFYSDLEHIATDLNSLSKKYSQSQASLIPSVAKYYHQHNRPVLNTIDALDWDWHDIHSPPLSQSPKSVHRKSQAQPYASSSLPRLNATKSKVRRRLVNNYLPTEYNESDLELQTSRSYDCTSSPLRRRKNETMPSVPIIMFRLFVGPSSVYFDSTDNTSGDENLADETLQMPSSPSVLTSSQTTEFLSAAKWDLYRSLLSSLLPVVMESSQWQDITLRFDTYVSTHHFLLVIQWDLSLSRCVRLCVCVCIHDIFVFMGCIHSFLCDYLSSLAVYMSFSPFVWQMSPLVFCLLSSLVFFLFKLHSTRTLIDWWIIPLFLSATMFMIMSYGRHKTSS